MRVSIHASRLKAASDGSWFETSPARPPGGRSIGGPFLRPAVWSLAASLLASAASAVGDELNALSAPRSGLADLSFEELATIKIATVYGASKHEQKITEAPSTVSIVTREDIQEYGYSSLADILRSVRGFYVTSDRKYSYIGVDGFNRPGDFGGRTLVMIDGHRLNDPLYDGNFAGTEFPLDVDLIERVEVVRGPGSSLYGNNAFFGIINVVTRRSQDIHGAEVSGTVASFDSYRGRVTYGQVFSNGISLTVSGSYYNSAGAPDLYYPEFDQRISHNPLAGYNGVVRHADADESKSFFLSLGYRDFQLEGGYVDREKHNPTAPYGSLFNDPRYVLYDERAFLDLKYHHEFAQDWEVAGRAYFDHYRFDAVNPYPYNYQDPPPRGRATLNDDLDVARSLGVDMQVSKRMWDRNRLTVGGEARWDPELKLFNNDENPPGVWLDINKSAEMVGVYLEDEFALCNNLSLNAGTRYDYFSFFGDTVSPRGAVIYNPWHETTLKFIYGEAYRAPNVSEWGYVAPGYKANPDLRPEKVRSYELACEQGLGTHLRLTTSLFLNQVNGLITEVFDPNDRNYYNDNIDGAESRGVEAELEAKWAPGIRARLSYTYADARDTSSNARLSNSPEHLGKLNLVVPLYRDKVFAGIEGQAMSSRLTSRGNESGVFGIVNLTLFSRELVRNLDLSVSLYNLFDQKFGDPVPIDFSQDTIQQDGRTFRAKLTYRF